MEENKPASPTVLSVSLKYGAIMAAVSIATFVIKIALGSNPFVSDWSGWVSLLVAIGIVVLAHNNFKSEGDGYMTYGQGFGIATMSMLISGVIGTLFTFVYITFIDTGLMDQFYAIQEETMRTQGQNEDAIAMALDWTKKLFWVIYVVVLIFFAVLCGLIVSIFTQKKPVEAI